MPLIHNKLKYVTTFFLFCVMQAWLIPAHANNARVTGNIVDAITGRPLPAATIEIRQRNNEIVSVLASNVNGRYESADLPEGLFTIKVILNGYRNAEEAGLRLIADKSVTLNFSLQQLPADIEQVIVVARANTLSGTAPVSATQLNREEIRRAPGTAGDVFRGLNSLPGVTATGEFSDFSVRGRGPRDNLILIDGIPYDRLVHFDESLGEEDNLEGGGRFSIFGQNVIGNAEFQPGGWEAAYGGANGSLLKLDISEGNTETPFASIKADLAGGEFLYDGPSYLFENTSLLVSLRHYNFGWLFETIGENEIGTPELSDVIIKSVSRLNENTTLKLLALYTPERYNRSAKNVLASTDFNDTIVQKSRQQAGMLGITLENLLGNTARLRNTVYFRAANDENSLGEAFPELSPEPLTTQNLFIEEPIITLDESERESGWRMDYNQLNQAGEFSVGTRLSYLSVDNLRAVSRDYPLFVYDQNDFRADPSQAYVLLMPATYNTRLDETAVRAAVYADQRFQVGPVNLQPGLRVEHDGLLDTTMFSPRFQANWQATAQTRLSLTTGFYYQAPRLLEIAANPANTTLDPERSTQLNLGIEHYFGNDYRMLLETYYHKLDNLIIESEQTTGILVNNGNGWSSGLDWLLSRRFDGKWSATLRYSYNKTRIDTNDGRGKLASEFNRPHLGNLTVSYEPNQRWAFSGQYQIASGRPADEFIINSNVFNDPMNLRYSREITLRNAGRFPSFQTLNIRADYRHSFQSVNLIAFVDIINVLGRRNINEVEFSPRTGESENDGLDTFPQLGITLEF